MAITRPSISFLFLMICDTRLWNSLMLFWHADVNSRMPRLFQLSTLKPGSRHDSSSASLAASSVFSVALTESTTS